MRRVSPKPQKPDHGSVLYTSMDKSAEWLPIDSVKLWAKNPRQNERSAEDLAEKIKVHGFRVSIIAWRENMTVYVGNTRVKAARLLGMTHVPISLQDFADEADAIAFALSENRSAEAAGWDEEKLADLFSNELESIDVDVVQAKTGFVQDEIDGIKTGWIAPVNDPAKEWQGMPEYEHEDQTSFRHIVVHFKSNEDATAFGLLIGQTVSENTRSLWFPPDEIGHIADKRYGEDGSKVRRVGS